MNAGTVATAEEVYEQLQRRLVVCEVSALSAWAFRRSTSSEWENLMATDSAVCPFYKTKHTYTHLYKLQVQYVDSVGQNQVTLPFKKKVPLKEDF